MELATEFRVDFGQLQDLVSYPVLAQGVGNLVWTPTAICLGKRPTILLTTIIFLAGSIWSIEADSLNSLIASRIVANFAGGAIESLGPAIIADLYMERYFATAMAVFSLFLSAGSQIGPLIGGYLIEAKGWRWFFILIAILVAFNLVMMIPFLPETNYRRVTYQGETAAELDKHVVEQLETKGDDLGHIETNVDAGNVHHESYARDLFNFRNRGVEDNSIGSWIRQFSLPFRFLFVPHALFATIAYGVALGGVVCISTLAPTVFSPPPYLLTSAGLGVFGLAGFIGIVIGYPFAGPVTDLLSRAVTRMSRDKFHLPEYRLPALIAPLLIAPPGLILFAYTVSQSGSIYVAAVGSAMQISSLVFVPSVVLSVVVDGWAQSGAEALVLINAGKNLVAFGLTLATPTWYASQGLVNMFWELAAIQWGVLLFAIPLFFMGPWIRQKTMWLV